MLDLDHQSCARRSPKLIVSYTHGDRTRTSRQRKETRLSASQVLYLRFQGEREAIASDRLFSGGSGAYLPLVVSSSETKSASLVNGLFMHLPTSVHTINPRRSSKTLLWSINFMPTFHGGSRRYGDTAADRAVVAEVKPGCIKRESMSFAGQTEAHFKPECVPFVQLCSDIDIELLHTETGVRSVDSCLLAAMIQNFE